MIPRKRIIETARSWIDTPYQHQASVKGTGCDCLGLIRGVWREIYGPEPMNVPPYSANWEEKGPEMLHDAAQKCLTPIDDNELKPGDVMLFRMKRGVPCRHIAIAAGPTTIIHAYWGRAVVESHLVNYWQRRWAYSFSFPELKA